MTVAASPSIRERALLARAASRLLGRLSTSKRNAALHRIADLLEQDQVPLLEANARDIAAGQAAGLDAYYIERLTLNSERLRGIAADTRTVAGLPDPVGEIIEGRTLPNGIQLMKRRVPLGVIACIYESRPNVTVDIAALCLKSGNASVLRGGKEAQHSNRALGELIQRALEDVEIPGDAVQVVSDPDRAHIDELLKMNDVIDMMVPRGGESLIEYVRANATMPVVAHGSAVVNIYIDRTVDMDMAVEVVDNAKTRRYSICNAVDTLLIHEDVADAFLARMADRWGKTVTILADDASAAMLKPRASTGVVVEPVRDADWDTEHLAMRVATKVVGSLDEALAHIEEHSSHHSEAILTSDQAAAMRFLDEVDSACLYVNASTQFTDGAQFGLGAEVGISTQKTHARGPMGLRELTSYKWLAFGNGQVRPK